MKPIDLYKMKPQKETYELFDLFGYSSCHIKEAELDIFRLYDVSDLNCKNHKIKIKYYADKHIDERRVWKLASVWFDNKPVMIFRNAGREGDNFTDRIITDINLFKNMIIYIKSISNNFDDIVYLDENDDIPNLTSFYGYKLADS